MKKKRQYQKPSIETLSFINSALLTTSDNVGLIIGEGSNAAKYYSLDLWEDDFEE